jgi:hypothetical protein
MVVRKFVRQGDLTRHAGRYSQPGPQHGIPLGDTERGGHRTPRGIEHRRQSGLELDYRPRIKKGGKIRSAYASVKLLSGRFGGEHPGQRDRSIRRQKDRKAAQTHSGLFFQSKAGVGQNTAGKRLDCRKIYADKAAQAPDPIVSSSQSPKGRRQAIGGAVSL